MDAAPAADAAPVTAASAWHRRLAALGDRANPILVRIVRQELRSRAFVGVFVVLLVAAVIASIVVASFSGEAAEGQAARGLFGVLAWAWSFALCLVQPMMAFRTVSNERNEDTWDLVELTGMRPRRVLAGLFMASAVQGLLYTSALAPFMLMAYLLRGLDLILIGFALLVVPMASAAASALAVFAACLGANKASRALLGGLLAIGLTIMWLASASMWFSFEQLGQLALSLIGWGQREWLALGMAIDAWAAFITTMLVLAAALLTFRAANRSTGPRLLWYALWLNLVAWGAVLAWLAPIAEERSVVVAYTGFFALIWSAALGLFSITEDYELSPRQARSITQPSRWLKRCTWFLGPGAARGRWSWLLLSTVSLGVTALGLVTPGRTPHSEDQAYRVVVIAWALWCYLAIAFAGCDALYRRWLARVFPNPPLRRGFVVLVIAVANIAPALVLMVVDAGLLDRSPLGALSPIHGLVLFWDDLGAWSGTYLMLSIAGVLAALALARQGGRLAIRTQRVLARGDDRNPRGG